MAKSTQNATQMIVIGLAAAASISLLVWHLTKNKELALEKTGGGKHEKGRDRPSSSSPRKGGQTAARDADPTPRRTNASSSSRSGGGADSVTTAATDAATVTDDNDAAIHAKIEVLDKKGKALFKDQRVRAPVGSATTKQ